MSASSSSDEEEEAGWRFITKWLKRKYPHLGLTVGFQDLNDNFRYYYGKRAKGLKDALQRGVDTGKLEKPKGTGRNQVFSAAGAPGVVTAATWIITQAGVAPSNGHSEKAVGSDAVNGDSELQSKTLKRHLPPRERVSKQRATGEDVPKRLNGTRKRLEDQKSNKKESKSKSTQNVVTNINRQELKKEDQQSKAPKTAKQKKADSSKDKAIDSTEDQNTKVKKTIVWAKVLSYPWWPARIADPRKETIPPMLLTHASKTKNSRLVQFYGTLDYLWVPRGGIRDFRVNYKHLSKNIPPEHADDLEPAIDDAYDEYVDKYGELDDSDTVCENCKSPDDADRMLLCDKCNSGFHIYCLVPPMLEKDIPTTNWYCDACINAETDIDARGFVSSTSIGPGIVGLLNLGSTCYINSFIQCVNSATGFRQAFLHNIPPIEATTPKSPRRNFKSQSGGDSKQGGQEEDGKDEDLDAEEEEGEERITETNKTQPLTLGKRADFVLALQVVLRSIGLGNVDRSFLQSLRLAAGQALDFKYFRNEHQDINEFFMQALEYIHTTHTYCPPPSSINGDHSELTHQQRQALERWEKHLATKSSVVSAMFEGMITRARTCPQGHISTSYETFRILPLQFPCTQKSNNKQKSRRTMGGETTLADMLDQFSLDEKLRCRCEECGGQDNKLFTQKTEIFKFPHYLVIQLARFAGIVAGEGDDVQWWSNKITTEVSFPLVLDLRKRFLTANPADPPAMYNLIAVANHKGGVTGGHYYTFAKSADGTWYNFNDNTVKEVKDSQLVSEFAYMLVYERRKK